jgi:hypothetical protein
VNREQAGLELSANFITNAMQQGHKIPSLDPILSQMNPVHTHSQRISLISVLILRAVIAQSV